MPAPPCPARRRMISWRAATGTPRDDPDATGLTEPPNKNGDAPDTPTPPSPEPAGLRPNHTARPLRQRAEQEPNMNDLLDFVLDAHGGLKRWSGVSTVTAKLAVGGPFWGQQGFPDAFLDETLTIDTRRQHAVFTPWTAPGQSLTFDTDPGRVVLQTANGQT